MLETEKKPTASRCPDAGRIEDSISFQSPFKVVPRKLEDLYLLDQFNWCYNCRRCIPCWDATRVPKGPDNLVQIRADWAGRLPPRGQVERRKCTRISFHGHDLRHTGRTHQVLAGAYSKKVLLLVFRRGPLQFSGSFNDGKNRLVSSRVATLPLGTSVRCTAALETTPPTLREAGPITQGLATDACFMVAFSWQLLNHWFLRHWSKQINDLFTHLCPWGVLSAFSKLLWKKNLGGKYSVSYQTWSLKHPGRRALRTCRVERAPTTNDLDAYAVN